MSAAPYGPIIKLLNEIEPEALKRFREDPDNALYLCPFTHQIMDDPVLLTEGCVCNRSYVCTWLETHKTHPVTWESAGFEIILGTVRSTRNQIERLLSKLPKKAISADSLDISSEPANREEIEIPDWAEDDVDCEHQPVPAVVASPNRNRSSLPTYDDEFGKGVCLCAGCLLGGGGWMELLVALNMPVCPIVCNFFLCSIVGVVCANESYPVIRRGTCRLCVPGEEDMEVGEQPANVFPEEEVDPANVAADNARIVADIAGGPSNAPICCSNIGCFFCGINTCLLLCPFTNLPAWAVFLIGLGTSGAGGFGFLRATETAIERAPPLANICVDDATRLANIVGATACACLNYFICGMGAGLPLMSLININCCVRSTLAIESGVIGGISSAALCVGINSNRSTACLPRVFRFCFFPPRVERQNLLGAANLPRYNHDAPVPRVMSLNNSN